MFQIKVDTLNEMKTLQEIAVSKIIRFGISSRETLPVELQNEIESVEDTIRRRLTGYNYFECYRANSILEFDMSWNQGTWTFVQRGLFKDDEYDQRTVHIKAGKETFLSWVWGNVFGLQFEFLPGKGTCFMIKDFQLDPSTRRVLFHGYYYCQYSGRRRIFMSTFCFSATKFYVRVTAEERFWSKTGRQKYVWEACFQQPDPDGTLKILDDACHNPSFIKSTFDFLVREVWS